MWMPQIYELELELELIEENGNGIQPCRPVMLTMCLCSTDVPSPLVLLTVTAFASGSLIAGQQVVRLTAHRAWPAL